MSYPIKKSIQIGCFEVDIWDDGDITIAHKGGEMFVFGSEDIDAIHAAIHADDTIEERLRRLPWYAPWPSVGRTEE